MVVVQPNHHQALALTTVVGHPLVVAMVVRPHPACFYPDPWMDTSSLDTSLQYHGLPSYKIIFRMDRTHLVRHQTANPCLNHPQLALPQPLPP